MSFVTFLKGGNVSLATGESNEFWVALQVLPIMAEQLYIQKETAALLQQCKMPREASLQGISKLQSTAVKTCNGVQRTSCTKYLTIRLCFVAKERNVYPEEKVFVKECCLSSLMNILQVT